MGRGITWDQRIARHHLRKQAAELWSCRAYEASASLSIDEWRGLGCFSRRAFAGLLRRIWKRIPADNLAQKLLTGGTEEPSKWIDAALREALTDMHRQDLAAQQLGRQTRAARPTSGLDRMIDEACGLGENGRAKLTIKGLSIEAKTVR